MIARASRETPHLDRWRGNVGKALSDFGAKSDLARWLAGGDETKVQTWRVQINRVLHGGHVPGAEFVLAVQNWLDGRNPATRRRGR